MKRVVMKTVQPIGGAFNLAKCLGLALAVFVLYLVFALVSAVSVLAHTSMFGLGAGPVIGDVLETAIPDTNKIREVSLNLSRLAPDRFVLDTILRRANAIDRMSAPPQKNNKHEWFQSDVIPRTTTVDGVVAGGGLGDTVVFTDANVIRQGDIIGLPDNATAPGALAYILTMAADGVTATASRILSTTSETAFQVMPALADLEVVYKITPAKEEKSAVGAPIGTYPLPFYNFYEIYDQTVGHSATKKVNSEYGIHSVTLSEMEAIVDLRRSFEMSLIFGTRFNGTSGNNMRVAGGIVSYASTNDLNYTAGAMDEADLMDWSKAVFTGNNGSKTRIWVGTPTQTTEVDKILLSTGLQWNRDDHVLGVHARSLKTSHGTIFFISHQDLEEHGKLNWGLVIDPANLKRVTKRPLHILDATVPGTDGTDKRWIEESTIEVRKEMAFAIVRDTATDNLGI